MNIKVTTMQVTLIVGSTDWFDYCLLKPREQVCYKGPQCDMKSIEKFTWTHKCKIVYTILKFKYDYNLLTQIC